MGYSQRRFGGPANATGQPILINNVAFTVVGVTPSEFFGVDPASAPHVYLPMHASHLFVSDTSRRYIDPNYYWLEMMGRLRPGIGLAQAQAALAAPFAQWVASTPTNDRERANLPVLRLGEGAGGSNASASVLEAALRRGWGGYPGDCVANTANGARAGRASRRERRAARSARTVSRRASAVRREFSRQGARSASSAVTGIRVLTRLLANGQEGFTLHAELNWHVLAVTLGLSLVCGLLFGLAPAMQLARPALMPTLKNTSVTERRGRVRDGIPRPSPTQVLVVSVPSHC